MGPRCRSAIGRGAAPPAGRSGHFDLHQGNPAPRFVHCVGLDRWRNSRPAGLQEIDIMLGPQVAACATPVVEFDAALIRRLRQSGPRYTSYPTADRFSEAFGYGDYLQAVAGVRNRGGMHAAVALPAHPVLRHRLLLLRLQQDRHQAPGEGADLPRLPEARNRVAGAALRRHQPGRTAASRRRHADLPVRCADGRPDGARAPLLPLRARRHRRVLDRGRPAHGGRARASIRCGDRASTASASACRTSTPTCRRP